MIMLATPTLERRLLQTVIEEAEAKSVREWPPESVELSLILLKQLRESMTGMHRKLEGSLAEGVEAGSFVRQATALRAAVEEQTASLRELIDKLAPLEDAVSTKLLAALRSLEEAEKAFHDLLVQALARVVMPPPSLDWERLKKESDADFASGRSVAFTTREEMFEGLICI